MSEKIECSVFIAMNEDGDFVVVTDESDALMKLSEDVGGYCARIVKVVVKMTPPTVTETTVNVPDEAGKTAKVEAEVI
jgi:hypothetical protein